MDHDYGTPFLSVRDAKLIPAQVTEYFAYSFLSGFASDIDIQNLLNKYDFYIFPVVNPDGTLPKLTRLVSS